MNDALGVRLSERSEDLQGHLHQTSRGEPAPDQEPVEGGAGDLLHHHEQGAVRLDAEVVQGDDRGVVEVRDGARLDAQARRRFVHGGLRVREHHLEGDRAPHQRLHRAIDSPEAAHGDAPEHRVLVAKETPEELVSGRSGGLPLFHEAQPVLGAALLLRGLGTSPAARADRPIRRF